MKYQTAAIILIIILFIGGFFTIISDVAQEAKDFKQKEDTKEEEITPPNKWGESIKGFFNKLKKLPAEEHAEVKESPGGSIALYFKDGSVIVGELLEQTEDKYIIKWNGKETVIFADLVSHTDSPQEALLRKKGAISNKEISEYWPYKSDVVIRLVNNEVLDAKLIQVEPAKITLEYFLEGGGRIIHDLERSKIEYLIFKPVENKESQEIKASLMQLFPKMKFYQEGNITIITDSYITWVNEYKKTLRDTYTNIYLQFFELFKTRKPKLQNFIVIFDNYTDFIEYAITDGVPGWAVAGYFSPEDHILYLYNALGETMSEILFEAMVGESGRVIDDMVETAGSAASSSQQIFVEGQARQIKDKFWAAYSYYKGMYREVTLGTLRHEFTHEIFCNSGLQNIELSRFEKDRKELIEKKKEFLETKDYQKKAELIKGLLTIGNKPLEMRAANSWLAEGLATYCETTSLGEQNKRWLFLYQEMARENTVYPLETLAYYKMGSFPGVCPKAMLYLYAQSWAVVNFLIKKYPAEFMNYQEIIAKKNAEDNEDIEWLAGALGKDLRTIDKEFTEYMKKFNQLEDPYLAEYLKMKEIFDR